MKSFYIDHEKRSIVSFKVRNKVLVRSEDYELMYGLWLIDGYSMNHEDAELLVELKESNIEYDDN